MTGEDPMRGAGWGPPDNREGFSERDPALGRRKSSRRGGQRMPLGAVVIAFVGMIAGIVGGLSSSSGNSRLDLTVVGGIARAGFAIAILAGLWISFGSRERAPGARLIGTAICGLALLLLIVFA